MTMRRIGALAVAAGLFGAGVPSVAAQTTCRFVQIATTRAASPVVVTPLDAIAFPVPPVPATSTVVRQIVVCPQVTTPVITPVPAVIGSPVFGSPVFGLPVFETPIVEVPSLLVGQPDLSTAPAALPRAAGSTAPSPPAIVGAAPVDTVRDLATRSARYDRMGVTVVGTAAAVEQATDARGMPVTTFRLEAQGTSVGVVVWGHATVRNGETVRVSGPFYVSTPFTGASGAPWHDAIEADLLER